MRNPLHKLQHPSLNQMFGYRTLGFGAGASSPFEMVIAPFTITATGSQNITTADLTGRTPVAVMFMTQSQTTMDTYSTGTDGGVGYGAYDGTNTWAVAVGEDDGQTTTDTQRAAGTTNCMVGEDGDGTIFAATPTAFIADGITVNVTTLASNHTGCAIFFVGDGVAVEAGSVTPAATTNTNQAVSLSMTQTPNLVFSAMWYNNLNTAAISFGASNSSQRCGSGCYVQHGVGTTNTRAFTSNTDANRIQTSGGFVASGYAHNFSAGGFDYRTTGFANANARVYYLAISLPGNVSTSIGTKLTPTSTGTDAVTGLGFLPRAVIGGISSADGLNVDESAAPDCEGYGHFCFTTLAQFNGGKNSRDNSASSTTYMWAYDNDALRVQDSSAAATVAAAYSSMDAGGFTLNFTDVEVTDTPYYWYCAIS